MRALLIAACACVAVLAPQGAYAQQATAAYDSGVRFTPAPEEEVIVVTASVRPLNIGPEPAWMRRENALTRTEDGNQRIFRRRIGSIGPVEFNLSTTSTPLGLDPDIVPDRDANKVPQPGFVIRF
jgi:hypothetical protein